MKCPGNKEDEKEKGRREGDRKAKGRTNNRKGEGSVIGALFVAPPPLGTLNRHSACNSVPACRDWQHSGY